MAGMSSTDFDLKARARQAMVDAGFRPDFPPQVSNEVQQQQRQSSQTPDFHDLKPASGDDQRRDLRGLLWSSIDNETSRDLDQVEYVEQLPDGALRLLIGIADVD